MPTLTLHELISEKINFIEHLRKKAAETRKQYNLDSHTHKHCFILLEMLDNLGRNW